MKKILKNKQTIILVMFLLCMAFFKGVVKAETTDLYDETKKASLTIKTYITEDGKNREVLEGAEFTIYKVPNTIKEKDNAEEYIKNNEVEKYTKLTNSQGTVSFSELDIGRCFVVQTNAPEKVITKVESFLIDLPRSNATGGTWEYDVIIYPKNFTVYGSVTLTEENKEGERLEGFTWKLEKKESGEWKTLSKEYKTDKNGEINIENIEIGKYRLIEKSTKNGYIYDNSKPIEFSITQEEKTHTFNVQREKMEIQKYIKLSNEKYGKNLGVNASDTIEWRSEVKLASIIEKMNTCIIKEKISSNLNIIDNSIKIYGENNGVKEEIESENYSLYVPKVNGEKYITLTLKPEKLGNYDTILLDYSTEFSGIFNYGKVFAEVNLQYSYGIEFEGKCGSDYITETQVANAYVGAVLIYNIDEDGNKMTNSSFKIATSEENAKKGIFLKDINGNDISANAKDGNVYFYGLKYGENNELYEKANTSYWIVQVKTASYIENGEIKYYSLLKNPVKVEVNSTSHVYSEDSTTVVINSKGFNLPLTGGKKVLIPTFLGIVFIFISIINFIKSKKIKKKEKKK